MGDSFRDAAWDNQLDTMLDDLQASVQAGGSETHGYKNGYHSANGGEIGYINIHYINLSIYILLQDTRAGSTRSGSTATRGRCGRR